jgi:hypothetical protein
MAARNGDFAGEPGAYEQGVRLKKPVIDKGETVEVEAFVFGYGEIKSGKISVLFSDEIFDSTKSVVYHSLGKTDKGLFWGASKAPVIGIGFTMGLRGVRDPNWPDEHPSTMFLDAAAPTPGTAPVISTESFWLTAPMSLKLKTKDNIKPGKYTVEFFLTYFDGKTWKTSSKRAEFTVRNFIEKHAVKIGVMALVATGLSTIKTAVELIAKVLQ